MSLREAIEKRRRENEENNPAKQDNTAPPPNSIDRKGAEMAAHPAALPLSLRLFRNGNRRTSLPWGCYQGTDYFPRSDASDGSEQCEQIQMAFMRHDVLVRGHNLKALMEEIDGLRLIELREIPEKLHPGADPDETVILKIEIKRASR